MLPLLAALSLAASDGAPSLAVRGTLLTGYPDVFGITATLYSLRPIGIEAGASAGFGSGSASLRAGPVLALRLPEGGADYGRIAVVGMPAVGWRYIGREGRHSHLISLTAAVDAVIWTSPTLAFDLQLDAGVNLGIQDAGLVPEIRLAAGIAF